MKSAARLTFYRKRCCAVTRAAAALILLAFGFSIAACRNEDRPTVVVYTSADEHIARQVIQAFETKHDIRVLMVGDTEVKKTAGLVERIRAEKDRPRADVFWSSEVFMTAGLAEDGAFDGFEPQNAGDWPKSFRDAHGRWHGFAARARVIVFSPDRVALADVPNSWMDLTDPRFRGRVVMADPRFGTTGGHLGAMKAYWDQSGEPETFLDFIQKLVKNEVRILPSGNAGVVEAVARGEADVGMTDTDDVWAAKARDLNVELVYPSLDDEQHAGTLLIPNTVSIIKSGPNPSSARLFAEYLLSEEVERLLAESVSHNIPLRPDLAADYPEFKVPKPMEIDYAQAARSRSAAINLFMESMRGTRNATQSAGAME